jgi:tetratricopeptide (TPR) repeat protein
MKLNRWNQAWVYFIVASGGLLAVGCDSPLTIRVRCERPPKYEVPMSIRKVAIVEFGVKDGTEKKWGESAADTLAAAIHKNRRKYNRYTLVDRKRVSALMDERDFQRVVNNTGSAIELGKIARVDGMIYGSVIVIANETHEMLHIPTGVAGTVSIPVTNLVSAVTINFTMDDVQTSKTICSTTIRRRFDSRKSEDKDAYGDCGKNIGAITQRLIEDCVYEFLGEISQHDVNFKVELDKGNDWDKFVEHGNVFVKEGDYDDAMAYYRKALDKDAEDRAAAFNMGICYEAKGDLRKAETFYTRALRIKPKAKYIKCRKRVRKELGE